MSEMEILAEMMDYAEKEDIRCFETFLQAAKANKHWQIVLAKQPYQSAMRSFINYLARKHVEPY